MILCDYFRAKHDSTWDMALSCGVTHGTIRLPEDGIFDVTNKNDLINIVSGFEKHGIKPIVLEPLPNELHDHIKLGDSKRDESIEKFIKLLSNLHETDIRTVCFNFMAHYGWTRTKDNISERAGAKVTGFSLDDFRASGFSISEDKLWENYEYFIRAVVPYAEKYEILLALHPDYPPIEKLGGVSRIFTSRKNLEKAVRFIDSPYLGLTFCQACYYLMGEDLPQTIHDLADKIFYIHFRNVKGNKYNFFGTFHDNGAIPMAKTMKNYLENGINVPIRVDHVPTLIGEKTGTAGYDTLGRLFAIGYLKGIIEAFT